MEEKTNKIIAGKKIKKKNVQSIYLSTIEK